MENKLETLSQDIIDILLKRLKDEFTAFYMYRSMSNWCKNVGFEKAAEYFAKESEDELEHAKKLEQFMVDWNVNVPFPTITPPEYIFSDLKELIKKAYQVEYELYVAYEEDSVTIMEKGDMCVFDLLQFFRGQQTKSVAEYSDMLNKLEGVSGTKFEMLMLEESLF